MKKALYLLLLIVVIISLVLGIKVSSYASSNSEEISSVQNLFFPNIEKKVTPNDLLVMVFLYDDYSGHNIGTDYVFNMTDQQIENKYHNEIFGSGNINQQTWSVNDFYKENSKSKFYFNPILIEDNVTGIYPIRLNKVYDEKNFSSDMQEGFKVLTDKGLNTDGFKRKNGPHTQAKQVLCIFPKIKIAHVGSYSLSSEVYSDVAVTDFCSVVSTTTHELGHTLGMPDLYNQGGQATLMGEVTLRSTISDLRYPSASNNHTIPAHVDPLHKIALGWYNFEIVDTNKTVKLYPTTTSLYNIVIVPTKDKNQYYIIENRTANSFETQITKYGYRGDVSDIEDAGCSNYEGINIWRIDKLGYDNLHKKINRKGDFIIRTLRYPNECILPKKYSNSEDYSSDLKERTDIKITYMKNNSDGSIDVNISFDENFKNMQDPILINDLGVGLDLTDKTYSGNPIKTAVSIKNKSYNLKEGIDYTVEYKNNINAGTAVVTVLGKGNYMGSVTETFRIVKKNLKGLNFTINTSNKVYTGKNIKTSITLKNGSKMLKESTDYTITYKNNKNTGKATVIITGKGNYVGTITKTFKIVPKATIISSVKNSSKKSAKVTWKKDTQATGYEVYMSTTKKGKYKKVKTVTSNKTVTYKRTKLTKKKTYYFKVRSYKIIDAKKVYGAYSNIKSVRIKK